MNRVKQLPPEVISIIAAGEVIQRPVHVVKELVENSLDAQAGEITILLGDAGLDQIEVIDDGLGIYPEDLRLAVMPHATSKLSDLSDLSQLKSQGFRGEALASIAQVSHLQLASRMASSEAGYQISSTVGTISTTKPLGMPAGTRITVTNLFDHLPVRQEFLHQSKVELRLIVDTITALALAHPEIGFSLKNNRRWLFRLPSNQSLIERTQALLGNETFSQMLPVDHKIGEVHLTGFISQPSLWTKRPTKQYLFVNRRAVKHAKLQKYIHHLTSQVQTNKYYPLYSLHLEVNPAEIDVNIHPQKATIDLFKIEPLKQALKAAISPLLEQRPVTYSSVTAINYQIADHTGEYKTHRFRRGLMSEYHRSAQQKSQLVGDIDQLAQLYLIAPTSDGLLLVDQHALHERILYDELKQTFDKHKDSFLKNTVRLSLAFDVSVEEALLIEENLDLLQSLGIEITPFGNHSYKINAVPEILADHDILRLIKEILYQARDDEGLQVDSQTDALLASMACRLAVKAGDYVEPSKRKELVDTLLQAKHVGTCPHGRPVAIKISLGELDKLFGRK